MDLARRPDETVIGRADARSARAGSPIALREWTEACGGPGSPAREGERVRRRLRLTVAFVALVGAIGVTMTSPAAAAVPTISGTKFYDTNLNGIQDVGEPGIAGWLIDVTDGVTTVTATTDANGNYVVNPAAGTYDVSERSAAGWLQTAPASGFYNDVFVNQFHSRDLDFGNVCIAGGDAHTIGYWQNKTGQAQFTANGGLAIVNALPLFNATGPQADFANYGAFKTWLKSANAKKPKYMLSAQLAAMVLNVQILGVDDTSLVYAPLLPNSDASGFIQLSQLIADAIAALENPAATTLSLNRLSDALSAANSNKTFLQAGPQSCGAPVFT